MLGGKRPSFLHSFLNSGVAQSLAIFFCASIFIFPRWFEYEIVERVKTKNVTLADSITINQVNETVTGIGFTWLRNNKDYNLYYWGVLKPICFIFLPFVIMVVSSILMLRQMRTVTASLSASVHQGT